MDCRFVVESTGAYGNFTSSVILSPSTTELKTKTFSQAIESNVPITDTHVSYNTYNVTSTNQYFTIKTAFEGASSSTFTTTFSVYEYQITFTYLGTAVYDGNPVINPGTGGGTVPIPIPIPAPIPIP